MIKRVSISLWSLAVMGCADVREDPATEPAPATMPATMPATRVSKDVIDRLVERLSFSHGLWTNGVFPSLGLPETASTEQVVARVFEMTGFDGGNVKSHQIVETRAVRIDGSMPEAYTAVLVDTDMGRKIVLLQYQGTQAGGMWWSRVYDGRADVP